MASNAGESENDKSKDKDVPAVGETIPIVAVTRGSEKDGNVNRGNEGSDRETDSTTRGRRRKSVGSRLADLKSKIDNGTANEDERAEYERESQERKGRRGSTESPPKVDNDQPRTKGAWRSKYGDTNDRERVCVAMASYWATGLVRLSKYIDDNGGDPLIDLTGPADSQTRMELNGLLVLACDDILPPGFVVSAALIAAGATTTMLIQGAVVARTVSAKRAPQKPGVKTDAERAEDELERARKARPANPIDEPIPQKSGTAKPSVDETDKSKPPRERGVV